jgi:peptidyl-prolyl isomerase D
VIFDCGELPEGVDDGLVNIFKDGDMYHDRLNDLDEHPIEVCFMVDGCRGVC